MKYLEALLMTTAGAARGDVSVRNCRAEEFESILKLLRQLWPDLDLDPTVMVEVFHECLESDGYFALCAVSGGRVVGFCDLTVRPSLWQSGKLAYVDDLVVDESQRGRGIGAMLLERATEIASNCGCGHMVLDSFFHREAAHRFYEARGLERLGFIFGRDL
jgi:GNAT superfamily N-acetyltransferase